MNAKRFIRQFSTKSYYDTYKLSLAQRAFLIPYFGIKGLINPGDGNNVAGLGDASSVCALQNLSKLIKSTSEGERLLKEKPLISVQSLNPSKLRELPENTLGREYINYMDAHGFNADERSIVRFADDPELAYILVRYRQIHDFWHALSGLPPTLLGEVALKCYEWEVTKLPVALLSGTIGQLRLTPREIMMLWTTYIPWARRAGNNQEKRGKLMTYFYEKNLEKPIEVVRKELDFEMPPKYSS